MSELKLGVQLASNRVDMTAGVVADLIPTSRATKGWRRLVIPAGSSGATTAVQVEPGGYLVRALLPSGDLLTGHVEVEAGEAADLVLGMPSAARRLPTGKPDVLEGLTPWATLRTAEVRVEPETGASWFETVRDLLEGLRPDATLSTTETTVSGLRARRTGRFDWSAMRALCRAENPTTDNAIAALGADAPFDVAPLEGDRGGQAFRLDGAAVRRPSPEARHARTFALVQRGERTELVVMPVPWLVRGQAAPLPIDLVVPRRADLGPVVQVPDPDYGSMVAYLANGDLPSSRQVLDATAKAALFDKLGNPRAAAAGGYVLLRTMGPDEPNDDWFHWIDNLANWFEWLPDGAVLAGWRRLERPRGADDQRQAVRYIEQAVDRGIPLFTPVLRLLLDAMTILGPSSDRIERALPGVQALARRARRATAFTSVRLGRTRRD